MKSFLEDIRDFLINAVVVDDAFLPMHYADPERLDDYQAGFRTHGLTGENLVSEADGEWQPDWYVIALTGLDDPVFVATGEAQSGYPVYTALHGAGRWDAIKIAPSLAAFARLLEALAEVQEDTAEFERLIIAWTDPANTYWREVLDALRDSEDSEEPPSDSGDFDPADFEQGDLIVNDLGPHKLKVVQIISKSRGVSLKDALTLAETPPLKAASGVRLRLQRLHKQLEAAGATVEFRPES
ncbi:hypothetical protein PS3A_51660 [Pseudomonas sp. 3A(2025)]